MPTKRKRMARGGIVPDDVACTLGVGTGINHMPEAELKAMWKKYGARVTEQWRREYGDEPLVWLYAQEGGWEED